MRTQDQQKFLKSHGAGTDADPYVPVLDVVINDQTSPIIIVPANKTANQTTISVAADLNDMSFDVASATGFVDGVFMVLADVDSNRFMTCHQVGAISGNTVTVDTPLDFAYPTTTQVTNGATNLGVDGSSTTQVFSLRAADPGLDLEVDITRIIITCTTVGAVDMSTFGDIAGPLTNGLVLRRTDGTFNNIFNVKTNGEIASLMYDFQVYAATNPQQGQDGFVSRMTFAGQNKIGVAIRIGPGEDLELLVQDNLSTLTDFTVTFEGHVVVP
jgi:hypothetical protein